MKFVCELLVAPRVRPSVPGGDAQPLDVRPQIIGVLAARRVCLCGNQISSAHAIDVTMISLLGLLDGVKVQKGLRNISTPTVASGVPTVEMQAFSTISCEPDKGTVNVPCPPCGIV